MNTADQIIADYVQWKEKNRVDRDRRHEKMKRQNAKHETAVRELLRHYSHGATLESTNGYVYTIVCGYYEITVCDQTERIVGDYHCIPAAKALGPIASDPFLPADLKARVDSFIDRRGFLYYGKFPRSILSVLNDVERRVPPLDEPEAPHE